MEKNARVEKKRRVSKSFYKFIVLLKKRKARVKNARQQFVKCGQNLRRFLTALEIKKNRDISLNLRG